MTYCVKCGASIAEGAGFCAACGTPVSAVAQGVAVASGGTQSTGLPSNVAAALTYLVGFITGIVFLAIEPYNKDPFVRFHAFQSIFLSVVYLVISILWGAVFGMLSFIEMGFFWSLFSLVRLAFLLLWLFLMYKAYNKERFSLPVIGPLAAKQAG